MRENIKLTSSFIREQYSTYLLNPLSIKALPCWTQNGHSIAKESRAVFSSYLASQTIQEQLKKSNAIKSFLVEGDSKQKNGAFVGEERGLGESSALVKN